MTRQTPHRLGGALRAATILCGALLSCAPALGQEEARSDLALPPLEAVRKLRRARIAEQADRIDEARQLLEEAAAEHPSDPLPLLRLIEHHERFASRGPELAGLRARLTERLQDPELPLPAGSLSYLTLEPALEPPQLRVLEARLRSRLGSDPAPPPAAREKLLDALELVYVRLDDAEMQRQVVSDLLEIEATFARRWRALQLDRQLERWSDALALVRKLLDQPAPARTLVDLELWLLARTGEIEEVENRLAGRPLDNRPGEAAFLASIAWTLEDADRGEAAADLWRRILELEPEHAMALKVLAHLHSTPEEQLARGAALETRWQQEEDPQALLDEGTNLLAAGDSERALSLLERAAPHFPASEMAWYNLGLAALHLERWEIAEGAFRRAAELNSERAESLFNHGLALYELKRCDAALAPLGRAVELEPERFQAHYYRAHCLGELGRSDEARVAMERYRQGQAEP